MGSPLAQLASLLPITLGGVDWNVGGPCFFFVVMPVLKAIVCWQVIVSLESIPAQYRLLEPKKTWLLMVPFFALYWNFKVFPALAESFQACFYSHGVADVEDCGERLAKWYCGLSLSWILICFMPVTFPAAMVVMILFLIKTSELAKRLPGEAVRA